MLLHRYAKNGFVVRAKRGLYALGEFPPPQLFLANVLYGPSYISCEFALSYHRIIPETAYEITSITTKATRRFERFGKIFSYRKIHARAFTGYTVEQDRGYSFRIADPEKAFVDALYYRARTNKEPLSRFAKEHIDRTRALQYAELFQNKKLISMIKQTLA